ncbi:FecR domain-containing protein [Pseudomonas sp. 21LCFQ02]|uniref:FecR family protein n=1 Tax=Pseudomonas sp. 21LCFQ02 TaxID=2957505 RepID=UPI00209B7562|nr:FecR domain-containing protein [Pseudomonas sp. 21LCFQ02]MCO8167293.1 FecR domain-containing protein [Pseudomonas sp. 21LCFQ02]
MAPLQSIEQQAADWVIRCTEGPLTDAERQQFEHWQAIDARHAAAFERLQTFVGGVQSLRARQAPARAALNAGAVARRRLPLRGATWALLLALPLALLLRSYPPAVLLADQRSAPAQWQQLTLDDGSRLVMSGNSAVDIDFSHNQRQIKLLRGEILIDVARDHQRPFTVVTEDGRMRALGTRFTVKREHDSTLLSMLESKVAARTALAPEETQVSAGEQVRITREQVQRLSSIDPAALSAAWQRHQLVVDDRPLPEVLDELARQYRGHVQFDRQQLADLRVSAVLPLDNPQQAMRLISDVLPVRIEPYGPWWLQVERIAAPAEK